MYCKQTKGFTLVEMIIAIVVISVGVAGVLTAFTSTSKSSADPLVHKQMLAAAEEMMEEVLLQPYAISGTAPSNTLVSCGSSAARTAFDDVRDYNGYRTTGICSADGAAVSNLTGLSMSVVVASQTWQGISNTLKITVTVSFNGDSVVLTGWRTNYAA